MFVNDKLEEFNKYLEGKKVAIIGLGVSNLPLIDYLYEKKALVSIFDKREETKIDKEILDKVKSLNMNLTLGDDYLSNLKGFDLIFRSPSCLPNTKELVEEEKRGAVVTTEIELLIKMAPCTVIGVTGSDGKTTTTTLIYEILKKKGINAHLGGNIGIPLFTKLCEIKSDDIIVLELSSFQLMNMKVSPNISVITNITPNHLDYHTDLDEYINAKKCIFKSQDENGVVILNYDNDITREAAKEVKGKVIFFSSKEKLENGYIVDNDTIKYCENGLRKHILNYKDMTLKGRHNLENACCALAATKELVDTSIASEVITSFKGVEHRLEFIKKSENNVKWYNDSVSSSPTRTIAGLNSFDKKIILIAGGYDKNLDYTPIAKPILEHVKSLILIGQTKNKIYKAVSDEMLKQGKDLNIYEATSLEETVKIADEIAKEDDIVLFSPASASFDMFKNFADRGIKFKEAVKNIVK